MIIIYVPKTYFSYIFFIHSATGSNIFIYEKNYNWVTEFLEDVVYPLNIHILCPVHENYVAMFLSQTVYRNANS